MAKYRNIENTFECLDSRTGSDVFLKIFQVADHYKVQPSTVRKWARDGRLAAYKLSRDYRLAWIDVWACEDAVIPKGTDLQERYRMPLITKADIAAGMNVSVRTVDRWIYSGMPTRNVFGNVRLNPRDAQDWLKRELGLLAPLYPYLTDELI